MDAQREQRFRAHLDKHIKTNDEGYKRNTIESHVRKIKEIDNHWKIELYELDSDARQKFYDSFEYNVADERRGPPPKYLTDFNVHAVNTAHAYRNSIKEYRKFCGDFLSINDKIIVIVVLALLLLTVLIGWLKG